MESYFNEISHKSLISLNYYLNVALAVFEAVHKKLFY